MFFARSKGSNEWTMLPSFIVTSFSASKAFVMSQFHSTGQVFLVEVKGQNREGIESSVETFEVTVQERGLAAKYV